MSLVLFAMTDSLVKQAMALDNSEKAKLINLLNESMLTAEPKNIDHNWALDAQQRYNDYNAGKHESVDYSQIKHSKI